MFAEYIKYFIKLTYTKDKPLTIGTASFCSWKELFKYLEDYPVDTVWIDIWPKHFGHYVIRWWN